MRGLESIQIYLSVVAEQIRWKRARPILIEELKRHLEDQRDALTKEGKSPAEAERLAIEDMGDPVALGAELDRVHRPRPQWGLLAWTLALALTGAFLRVYLTAGWEFRAVSLERTVYMLLLGAVCLLGLYFLDISRLSRYPRLLYLAALILGLLPIWLSPTYNHVPYYARYVVLTYPIVYAFWLYSCREKGWIGFSLAILGGVPLAAVCVEVPYIMALLLLLFTGLVLLVYAIWQNWFGISRLAAGGVTLAVVLGCVFVSVYAALQGNWAVRLMIALHPEMDPMNRGFQGIQTRRVLEASQWIGQGHLETDLSFERFLPEAAYDMLPTTIVYYLGWAVYLLLIAAVAGLLLWLTVRGLRQKYRLGRLVVLATVMTLGLQSLFSIVLNLGCALFDVTFPLLGGNLHTVLDMAMIGLALSVLRGDSIAREDPVSFKIRRIKRIHLEIEYE